MTLPYRLALSLCFVTCWALGQSLQFRKTVLSREFLSEGATVADLNHDGKLDIVAGYNWFEAPSWRQHQLAPTRSFDPRQEYSNSFLNLGMDVNLDGWDDVVIVDFPGKPAFWFENPKKKKVNNWPKHVIADSMGVSNESPAFVDVDADGRLDIICADRVKKQIVWLQAPTKKGEKTWKRHPLSAENVAGTENFSHGIGYGDINMDGRPDVIIREGWFEGKKELSAGNWTFHAANLGDACSHMQVLDLDADGLNDVLSASAHALGIWWHKQVPGGQFVTETLSKTTSQTHATLLADLNADGQKEFITGKRYLAHNGHDPGDADAPLLLYFELTPGKSPFFKEHIIDSDSGVGLNITVKDINRNGRPDIIVANKNGVFLFSQP